MSEEIFSEIKNKKSKIKKMPKKSFKIILIVVAFIIGTGIIAGVAVSVFYRPYMAVYLATGDIYFGRTSVFPRVQIHDPWFLRRADDGSFSLERISDVVWAPEGGIKINEDQIIFMSKLSELSPVVATMEGRNTPQQQIPQQQAPQQQAPQQQVPQQLLPEINEGQIDL